MTDRELLELAAKAAGMVGYEYKVSDVLGYEYMAVDEGGSQSEYWNPLTDDGDALRLAVKLHMNVEMTESHVYACAFYKSPVNGFFIEEQAGNDPYASTRRAIAIAAATIGRIMR